MEQGGEKKLRREGGKNGRREGGSMDGIREYKRN